MTKNVIASNVVATRSYKERSVFDKLAKSARTIDAELAQSISASMKTMLGNKQAIAVRVTAR